MSFSDIYGFNIDLNDPLSYQIKGLSFEFEDNFTLQILDSLTGREFNQGRVSIISPSTNKTITTFTDSIIRLKLTELGVWNFIVFPKGGYSIKYSYEVTSLNFNHSKILYSSKQPGAFIGERTLSEDLKGTFLVDKAGNYITGKTAYKLEDLIVDKNTYKADVDDYPYPEIVESVNTAGATTTSYTVTLPVCEPGELIMVHFKRRQDASSPVYTLDTAFSGNNWILSSFGTSYATDSYLYYKIAEGSGLDAFRMNLSVSRTCYATAWRIKYANKVLSRITTISTGSTFNGPNVTTITPVKGLYILNALKRAGVSFVLEDGPKGFDQYHLRVSSNGDTYWGKYDKLNNEPFPPTIAVETASNGLARSIIVFDEVKAPYNSLGFIEYDTTGYITQSSGVDRTGGAQREFNFNGSNFFNTNIFPTTDNFTYIFFNIKPDDGRPASRQTIMGSVSTTSSTQLYVDLLTTGALEIRRRNSTPVQTIVIFPDGETEFTSVFIAIEGGPGTTSYWINGVFQETLAGLDNSTSSAGVPILVGASNRSNGIPVQYFTGKIRRFGFVQQASAFTEAQKLVANNYLLSL